MITDEIAVVANMNTTLRPRESGTNPATAAYSRFNPPITQPIETRSSMVALTQLSRSPAIV